MINDPHVITIARELPHAQALLSAIYQCDYKGFFKAVRFFFPFFFYFVGLCNLPDGVLTLFALLPSQILSIHPDILEDRFLGPVVVYLVREYRVLAYSQFLEAYKR